MNKELLIENLEKKRTISSCILIHKDVVLVNKQNLSLKK
jgi:hypothetical protein